MRTYELKEVPEERKPVIGEIRFSLPLLPMPGEPLASMIHGYPLRIVWDGKEWMSA